MRVRDLKDSRLAHWLLSGPGLAAAAAAVLVVAGQAAFAYYETAMLGLPLVREEPAGFAGHQLAQIAFTFFASAWLVAGLVGARARGCGLEVRDLARSERRLAVAVSAAAGAAALLFVAAPAAFGAQAQEDRPLEWASALLLFAASGLFLFHAGRGLFAASRRREAVTGLILAGGLAALLFVMGMEEISWLQRVVGFETPAELAKVNWQGEFNLHNVQTDLSEAVYYVGSGLFLIQLPLLGDVAPAKVASHRLLAFAPVRSVAAVSAPAAIFTYGHWNLFPIQLCSMLTFFVLLAYAWAAGARGSAAERRMFVLIALAVAVGQILFLAFGPAMTGIPDATEYKEFFIAAGLAWYAVTATRFGRGGAR